MARRPCVDHCADGRRAAPSDSYGLTEIHSIVTAGGTAAIFGGAPWWWESFSSGSFTISHRLLVSGIIFALGTLIVLALTYLRHRTARSLEIKHLLHMITHKTRDQYANIQKAHATPDIKSISDDLCDLIRSYFVVMTWNRNVGVALRIAKLKNGAIVYETVGRSGLNLNREQSSEPVSANEGVAKLLQDEKSGKGVTFFNRLEEAATTGAYKPKENDELYREEIKSFMVAPINGWDGEKCSMLGMLYITSGKESFFRHKLTDSMAFIVDAIANVYSELIVGRLEISKGA